MPHIRRDELTINRLIDVVNSIVTTILGNHIVYQFVYDNVHTYLLRWIPCITSTSTG